MLPPENLLAVVNRKLVPAGQARVAAQAYADLLCSLGRQMKRVSTSGRQKKEASTSQDKTEEFLLSPGQSNNNAEEGLTAKTEYIAGEKGLLLRYTLNAAM